MYVFQQELLGYKTQLDEERQGYDECTSKNTLGRATFPPFTIRRHQACHLQQQIMETNILEQSSAIVAVGVELRL